MHFVLTTPHVFAVWWINPVDRLTCSHCDALRDNILKQLLKSQLSHAINPPQVVRCASRRKQNTGSPSRKLALCPRKWGVSGGVSNSFRPCEMKDLFRMAQLDITWNRFPSTPGEIQNLACQKIEHRTRQMNRMHVRNAFDHGRLDAQTSQARFVQQQCYCKNIQLMKRSESRLR